MHRAERGARLIEGRPPVDAERLTRELAELAVEVRAVHREVNPRDAEIEPFEDATDVGERELAVRPLGHPEPAQESEELDRLRARLDLHPQVSDGDLGELVEQRVRRLRLCSKKAAQETVILRPRALHKVGRERERRAAISINGTGHAERIRPIPSDTERGDLVRARHPERVDLRTRVRMGSWMTGPGANSMSTPIGGSGVMMSWKRIAASIPKRRMGCIVTSQQSSGVRASCQKL